MLRVVVVASQPLHAMSHDGRTGHGSATSCIGIVAHAHAFVRAHAMLWRIPALSARFTYQGRWDFVHPGCAVLAILRFCLWIDSLADPTRAGGCCDGHR